MGFTLPCSNALSVTSWPQAFETAMRLKTSIVRAKWDRLQFPFSGFGKARCPEMGTDIPKDEHFIETLVQALHEEL